MVVCVSLEWRKKGERMTEGMKGMIESAEEKPRNKGTERRCGL